MNELQHFMLKQTDFIMFVGSVEGYTNWKVMDDLDQTLSAEIAFLLKTYGKLNENTDYEYGTDR